MSDTECKYTYKVCTNPRTVKRDGSLHRLCDHHRAKANALQKVYATKRREELRTLRQLVILGQTMPEPLPLEAQRDVDAMHATMEDYSLLVEGGLLQLEPLEAFSDVAMLSDEEYAYLCKVL
ncbi:Aste57867_10480 [Aphanomyces stellatus]|uniref:Aste57867_10480 protein n=1 Tax=Aphanomyces stellatus TaxID=120398 RepID=A0A485KRH1_9STRA|nr:hypothetical protein As57867_010440 [Aphanomyces stellatus]VFT87354.1 Aste57867_10480 [Aphanomyces stellatus]